MSVANTYEPEPVANLYEPVWESVVNSYRKRTSFPYREEVVKDFRERDEFGRSKHGVPLQPFNSRNPLNDLKQEILDSLVYSYQTYLECEDPIKKSNFMDIHITLVTMYENLILIEK